MVMQERTLELNVISAQNLKKVQKFGNQACYVVAYIHSRDKKASRVDKEGGLNPKWNAKLTLTCDDKLLQREGKYITMEIYSRGTFRNKLIGSSRISLFDVGKQAAAAAPPKRLSFEVQRKSGTVQGALNVSVNVQEKITISPKGHSGKLFFPSPERCRRQEAPQNTAAPKGYSHTGRPTTSWQNIETISPYRPQRFNFEPGVANAYFPPSPSSSASSGTRSSTKDAPVMAYPFLPAAYPPRQYGQQNSPHHSGSLYVPGSHQSSYSSTPATAPLKGQQIIHSKPPRRQGGSSGGTRSSGMGTGPIGGVLGGFLLRDMVGDVI